MNTHVSAFSFSIITPVYNEEAIIVNSINQNLEVLEKSGVNYEMVIINDGSRDRSGELITENFGFNDKIRIIHSHNNMGFGMAVKEGLQSARNVYLLSIPADSPLTTEVFDAFKAAAAKADIVVSYRIARLGYTPRMRLNSHVYHLLIEIIFDIHLVDFNWIHLYNRKVFTEGNIKITSKGIFMLAEVLIQAQKKGYTFCEIPVAQSERLTGIASASKFSSVLKTSLEMITFWYRFNRH